MPWKVTDVFDQRMEFVALYQKGEYSMAELCKEFEISRPTGYKYWDRFQREGPEGLYDLSRAPHNHPNEVPKEVEAQILALKARYPTWGPRKLQKRLVRDLPDIHWPVASTIGELLKREGLVCPRRRRPRATPSPKLTAPNAPNVVWCADFKGWFRTQDGHRCDPFTLMDAHSRYLLRCQALSRTDGATVKPLFVAAFLEFGLPEVIRTDNGPPFGTTGLGGLSRLSVWFLKLGIHPERIKPGCPDQNARHERMHLTLQCDLTHAPAANHRAQQRAFDRYRGVYNEERPHEALEYKMPADVYVPSVRPYPLREPEFTYPSDYAVRQVRGNGCIRMGGREICVSTVLIGEPVGLRPLLERHWALYVGPLLVAVLDEAAGRLLVPDEAVPMMLLESGEGGVG